MHIRHNHRRPANLKGASASPLSPASSLSSLSSSSSSSTISPNFAHPVKAAKTAKMASRPSTIQNKALADSLLLDTRPFVHASARSLSFDTEPALVLGTASSSYSSTSSTRLSDMSTTEKTLSVLLGLALFLALVGACFCCIRQRRRRRRMSSDSPRPQDRAETLQHQPQQHQQQPAIPLHQPPETPSSLSSFTRISSAAPEMSAMLTPRVAGTRPNSAAAGVGFSLARFFVKHASAGASATASGKARGGRGVYVHNQDHSLQKTPSMTPSTRSSTHDYYWDLSHARKERCKDGFPVITLTSPTNSETSIPIPVSLQEEPQLPSLSTLESPSSSSSAASSSAAPLTPLTPMHWNPTSRSTSTTLPFEPSRRHSNTHLQSVPQHMLLHPSYTYSRPLSFKNQASTSASSNPATITDFPPTYEEAVDGAGPSARSSKVAAPLPDLHVPIHLPDRPRPPTSVNAPSVTLANAPPSSSSPSMQRLRAPLYEATAQSEGTVDERCIEDNLDSECSQDVDSDPLASLTLGHIVARRLH